LLALRRRLRPDNYGAPDARRVQVDSGTGLVRIDYGIGPIPDFRLVVLLSGKGSTLDEAAPGGGTILMERGVTRTARVLELAPWAVLLIRPAQQEDQTAR
jgi:hypothetical protein